MKKRVLAVVFAAFMLLAGCGNTEQTQEPENADAAFMADLSASLMERWDESDKVDAEMLDPYSEEYQTRLIGLIDIELNNLSEYRSATFEDRNLQEDAISYINILEDTKEIADLLTVDYTEYSTQWTEAYNERAKAIKNFVDEYGLTVDEAHQAELEDFIGTAKLVEADEARAQKADEMIAALDFQPVSTSGSYTTYQATMTNNTGADFQYINMTSDLMDDTGLIVGQAYANTNTFVDGKSIVVEFMTDKQFTSYEVHSDYYFAE